MSGTERHAQFSDFVRAIAVTDARRLAEPCDLVLVNRPTRSVAELEALLAERRAVLDRVYRQWLRGEQFTSRLNAERKYVAELEAELVAAAEPQGER